MSVFRFLISEDPGSVGEDVFEFLTKFKIDQSTLGSVLALLFISIPVPLVEK